MRQHNSSCMRQDRTRPLADVRQRSDDRIAVAQRPSHRRKHLQYFANVSDLVVENNSTFVSSKRQSRMEERSVRTDQTGVGEVRFIFLPIA